MKVVMTDEELGKILYDEWRSHIPQDHPNDFLREFTRTEFHEVPWLERMAFIEGALAVRDAISTEGMKTLDLITGAAKAALLVLSGADAHRKVDVLGGIPYEQVANASSGYNSDRALRTMHSMQPGVKRERRHTDASRVESVTEDMIRRGVDFIAARDFNKQVFMTDWGVKQFLEAALFPDNEEKVDEDE
jgi:hypothetical protein